MQYVKAPHLPARWEDESYVRHSESFYDSVGRGDSSHHLVTRGDSSHSPLWGENTWKSKNKN